MIFALAMEGNLQAAIFYAKCRGGWRQEGEDVDATAVEKEQINHIKIEVIGDNAKQVD